jgi:NDP-sugar pyrophosphorylase family protein
LLRKELTEPFIVMNGDILTKLDLRAFYDFGVRADSDLTVGTKIISTPFAFGNVTADANNHIVDIEEKPDLMMEIIGGIYCMKPGVLAMVPDGEYFGMDTLIKKLLAARKPVSRYIIREYWLDIGQIEDYSKAQDAYSKHFS